VKEVQMKQKSNQNDTNILAMMEGIKMPPGVAMP